MTMHFYFLVPDTVFVALVNQTVFTYPIAECEFDTVTTGAFGDIKVGMTVEFQDGSGNVIGRQRIRKAADSDTIFFGRSSQGVRDGEVNLEDDATIRVYDDYRVWSKTPFIDDDGTIYKDHDIVVGNRTGADTPPKCNLGEGVAATVDSVTDVITVAWDASTNSKAYADGESISSYLWDVGDGTITVGSTSTAAITATFPAGFRWVTCTVTDSNSQTHTMRVPVFARDPNTDDTLSTFNIVSHKITPQGQQMSVTLREPIVTSTHPDGTLVMVWDGEPSDENDRSHMVFIGWHHTDPANINARRTGILQDTTLECLDVAGKLDTLPGFPLSIAAASSPATWSEMVTPNMDKYLHYLLHWHSTALELADWTDSGTGSNNPFVILGSDGESLFDQVARRAKALVPDYVFGCNTLGQLQTVIDPMLQDTGDRTATIQATLTTADWSNIRYIHQRPPRFHWHRGNAIKADTSTISAYFCIAPGEAPGQGEQPSEQGEQLAQSQSDLNACEGHRYARINAFQNLFGITLAAGDDQDIEPSNMTWVRLNISSSEAAQRGLTFTNERGLVQEININYQYARTGLVKTVNLTWERETSGTPAVTVVVDAIDDPLGPVGWFPPDPVPNPGPNQGDGFGTVYFLLDAYLARTRDFSAASPAWVDITPAGATGTFYDFILDPWAPSSKGYLATDDGIWKSTDLNTESPSFSQVLDLDAAADSISGGATGAGAYKVVASINQEDYVATVWTISTGSLYCSYSEDGGDTWNHNSIVAASTNYKGGLDIVPYTIGGSLTLYIIGHFTGGNMRLYKSSDKGATWALAIGSPPLPDPDFETLEGVCVQCPYEDNEAGNVVHMGWYNVTTGGTNYSYYTEDGSTIALIGSGGGTNVCRHGIEGDVRDRDRVVYWRYDSTLWISTTGPGGTFSQKTLTGLAGTVIAAGGFPTVNDQYYILTTSGIYLSTDGGDTVTDKTGDWGNGFSVSRGGGVVVPDWTE